MGNSEKLIVEFSGRVEEEIRKVPLLVPSSHDPGTGT